jgi:hypothetical protein
MYYTQGVKRIYPSKNFFYTINNPLLIIYTPLKDTDGSPVSVFLFVKTIKISATKKGCNHPLL